MRVEIHVKTLDEARDARAAALADFSADDVAIIVDQPTAKSPAERQDRQTPKGKF